jgi:hypothetical protein
MVGWLERTQKKRTYKYTMPQVKQPQVKQPQVKQPRVKAIKQLANINQPSVPDNQKKTCKVVKRRTATGGYTGARIDPKGCKVRTTKSQAGVLRKYNKQGERKITLKTKEKAKRLAVAGTRQHPSIQHWRNKTVQQRKDWGEDKNMIYDTGAQVTTMSRELANRLQINYLRTTGYRDDFIGGVGGTRTPVKVLLGTEFWVCIDDEKFTNANWMKVKVDLFILLSPEHSVSNLLGVDAMRQIGSRLKVKYK